MGGIAGYRAGLRAEWIALWFLRLKGYRLLAARYKTPVGEIDLVMRRGRVIVFAEVKMRQDGDTAAFAIHPENQMRVRRAAELYLQKHPRYTGFDIRFDALLAAKGFWPRHIVNAF